MEFKISLPHKKNKNLPSFFGGLIYHKKQRGSQLDLKCSFSRHTDPPCGASALKIKTKELNYKTSQDSSEVLGKGKTAGSREDIDGPVTGYIFTADFLSFGIFIYLTFI